MDGQEVVHAEVCDAVDRVGSNGGGVRKDRILAVDVDLGDEIAAGDACVAEGVDGDGGREVGERGEEEAGVERRTAEIVGGEGGVGSVDDGEEAAAEGVDGDCEDGGVGGEVGVGDEGLEDAGVGDGVEGGVAGGGNDEVLGGGVPREGVGGEGGGSDGDDVWAVGEGGAHQKEGYADGNWMEKEKKGSFHTVTSWRKVGIEIGKE